MMEDKKKIFLVFLCVSLYKNGILFYLVKSKNEMIEDVNFYKFTYKPLLYKKLVNFFI